MDDDPDAADCDPLLTDNTPDEEREALVTIAHGAVLTSGGVSGQRALTAATEFALARGLGPTAYGVYALAWRIAQLLSRLVTFGSVPALQRYLPEYAADPKRQGTVAGLAYATTLGLGVAIAVAVWLSAPRVNALTVEEPAFSGTMAAFGLLVGLLGLVMIASAIFRAVGSARGEIAFNKLLRPGVRLAGAVGALALGYSVVGVAGGIVAATAVLAVVAVPLSARATGVVPSLRGARGEVRRFYNHAAPVAMSSLGKVFQNRVDVLLVGALLTATAAGVYNVVLVLIAIAWIPLLSFNQLLPPVASELYADGRVETLNAVYTSVTRQIVTSVVPILAVLVVFGRELLGLFGEPYAAGYVPLVVYLGGVFVGSAVGATGWLLMMTDHQYARMILDWLLAVLNVALTYTFVLRYGLVGAALGTSVAIAVQNGIQVVLLRQFEGLWPFDRTYLRPLAAGGVALLAMRAVREVVPGRPAIVVGAAVGLAVYVGALYAIGVDPRDRLVVRTLAGRYRSILSKRFGDNH
ncbi:lipopolysaccharide biosynthesis protein [Halorubrum sp. DTA46]|uniref:lipopolysaccharide biosynthesis protein n=1 Tax=Halorubrum sp. DTA46 TaxID=3402162 RepID=UPI003AABE185